MPSILSCARAKAFQKKCRAMVAMKIPNKQMCGWIANHMPCDYTDSKRNTEKLARLKNRYKFALTHHNEKTFSHTVPAWHLWRIGCKYANADVKAATQCDASRAAA